MPETNTNNSAFSSPTVKTYGLADLIRLSSQVLKPLGGKFIRWELHVHSFGVRLRIGYVPKGTRGIIRLNWTEVEL